MSAEFLEKRLHTRHRAKTKVHVRVGAFKEPKMCIASNLSANGVAIKTEGMGLTKGQVVELSFAIDLGLVVKIHKRTATVAHITSGITGFIMESFLKAVP